MSAITKVVLSIISAAAAAWFFCQATNYISLYSGKKRHREDLCGKQSDWDWSLGSDCFRRGFLWPVILLVAAGASFVALAIYCLLPRSLKSSGVFGVGSQEKPVRHPLGPATMRDNRTGVGCAAVALSVAQATLLTYAWVCQAEAVFSHTYYALVSCSAVVVAIANAVFLARYMHSSRML
ncbi:hypothetical protein IWW39_006306, partial [Coemansia spiralis]